MNKRQFDYIFQREELGALLSDDEFKAALAQEISSWASVTQVNEEKEEVLSSSFSIWGKIWEVLNSPIF